MSADLSVLLDQLKARIEEGEWFGGHEAAALVEVAAAAERRSESDAKTGFPDGEAYRAAQAQIDALARLRTVLAEEEEEEEA